MGSNLYSQSPNSSLNSNSIFFLFAVIPFLNQTAKPASRGRKFTRLKLNRFRGLKLKKWKIPALPWAVIELPFFHVFMVMLCPINPSLLSQLKI